MSVSDTESIRADKPVRAFPVGHTACYLLFGIVLTFTLAGRASRWPIRGEDGLGYEAAEPAPQEIASSVVRPEEVESRIDPNTASWSELASLPGIGEVLAKRIVEFRETESGLRGDRGAVFERPEDLEAVRGIGPKTVARLASHLRFGKTASRPAG